MEAVGVVVMESVKKLVRKLVRLHFAKKRRQRLGKPVQCRDFDFYHHAAPPHPPENQNRGWTVTPFSGGPSGRILALPTSYFTSIITHFHRSLAERRRLSLGSFQFCSDRSGIFHPLH
jgi:hypothetical protein